LFSSSGTIGTSGNNILANTSNLVANTSGNVYVSDAGPVTISGASTGNTFWLTDTAVSGGAITVSNSITATATTLQAGTNAGVAVNANVATGSATIGSVTINANGSGIISDNGSGTVTAGTVSLNSGSGAIGTLATSTTNLTANTTGNVTVNNSGAGAGLTIGSGTSSANNFTLTNDQAITVSGGITANGTLSLTTNANNGGITFNASTTGANGVTLLANGTGIVTVASGQILSTINSPISITAGDISFAGTVNGGGNTVSILPNANQAVIVGATTTTSGDLNVTSGSLGHIGAGTLIVGSASDTGNFSTGGNIDVHAGSGAGQFNLTFNTGGNYTNTGNTITLGSKTLNVTAAGTANTGAITSTVGTTVNVTAGNTLTVGGNVTLGTTTPGGIISLTTNSNNGAITVTNNVSTGSASAGSITLNANGSGTISGAGTLTTGTLSLTSVSGAIGTLASSTTNLTANTFGSIETVPLPAFNVPAKLMSPVVIDIGLLDEVVRDLLKATVVTPVPLVDSVTPVAPDELALNVMPALFALVVNNNVPLAVMAPETVIAWSFVSVKLLAELVPEPIVKPEPAPELLMVTLPKVLAVRLVVLLASVPIAPLTEVNDNVPVVKVPAPDIVPEPLAFSVMLPALADPVDTLLVTVIAPLLEFVVREIIPPGVVVPRVTLPPTVRVLPAVTLTVVPTVDVIAPVLAVPAAVTFNVFEPKVIVLPVLV